jgi:ABC-type uncharacterized transport system permease subunit
MTIGGIPLIAFFTAMLAAGLVAAAPLVMAALGEAVGEKSGLLNLGIEGMMLCGAFFGFYAANQTGGAIWGVLAGIAAGLALGLLFAILTVSLRVDQVLVGLAIGFGGVVALLGVDVAGRPGELLGAALILVATLGYASATIIVNRRLADLDPLGPIAASLALATLVLVPAVVVTPPHGVPPGDALGALAVLGFVCTALGLVLFFRLIVEAGPSRASVITYVNPLVAVVLGVLVLDERFGAMSVVGLVAILGGSWLSTRGRARRVPPAPAVADADGA